MKEQIKTDGFRESLTGEEIQAIKTLQSIGHVVARHILFAHLCRECK